LHGGGSPSLRRRKEGTDVMAARCRRFIEGTIVETVATKRVKKGS
jgi:hypothetical protein